MQCVYTKPLSTKDMETTLHPFATDLTKLQYGRSFGRKLQYVMESYGRKFARSFQWNILRAACVRFHGDLSLKPVVPKLGDPFDGRGRAAMGTQAGA